jgi:hypothetical protein
MRRIRDASPSESRLLMVSLIRGMGKSAIVQGGHGRAAQEEGF